MNKLLRNAILSVLFALCCVFVISSNSLLGVKANESTNEILEEEQQEENINQEQQEESTNEEQEQINQEQVEQDVKDIAEETEKLIMAIISIVASLGVSWGSISTVISWIKKRINNTNNDIALTNKALAEHKEQIINLIEQNKEYKVMLEDTLKMLKSFYDKEKQKSESVNKAIATVLTGEDDNECV